MSPAADPAGSPGSPGAPGSPGTPGSPPGAPGATGAELLKLAHALGVGPDELDALTGVPVEDLRTLRQQVGEMLFQADRPRFARLAALSKVAPVALSAKLTEHAFPPLLSARTAELLEPDRAAELVQRLSPAYLADVSVVMDAARAPRLVASLPASTVGEVAAELARRPEWVVIGAFVAQVSAEGLRASVERFDGEQLLRIGYVLDDVTRSDEIADLVTGAQLDAMLRAAVSFGLWAELGTLVARLGAPQAARVAERFTAADESDRAATADAAASGALDAAAYDRLAGTA